MYITLSLPQRGGLEDSLPTFFFLYNSAIEKPVLIYSTSIQTQVGRSVGDLYKSRNRIGFWSENGAALTETSIINFGSTNFTDVSTLIATHIAHATASFRAVVSNNISSLRHCALYTLIEPRVVNQLDRYIYYAASVGCISQGHSPPLSLSLSLSLHFGHYISLWWYRSWNIDSTLFLLYTLHRNHIDWRQDSFWYHTKSIGLPETVQYIPKAYNNIIGSFDFVARAHKTNRRLVDWIKLEWQTGWFAIH